MVHISENVNMVIPLHTEYAYFLYLDANIGVVDVLSCFYGY